jgi:hypothetical protein
MIGMILEVSDENNFQRQIFVAIQNHRQLMRTIEINISV